MSKSYLSIALFFCTLFIFFSCDEILMEEDISEAQIKLVAPMDDAQFFSTGISFFWEETEGADRYRLQIARPSFEAPLQIVLDTLITSNSFSYQLNLGTYEWRVKAINGSFETVYKNRFFTIVNNEDFGNNTVVLISPANNLITKIKSNTVSWQSVIGAVNYQFQVVDQNDNIIDEQITTNTNLNYNFHEGITNWRVRASNGSNQTLYSSRSILVDTTQPNTPILTVPVNESTSLESNVSFQWTRVPITGSTESDSIYVYKNAALSILQSKNLSTSPFEINLDSGIYYWFVKSFDQAGNVSSQSTTFRVNVDN